MDQHKIRVALSIFSAVSFALILYFVDYSDMSWVNNQGVYLTLILYGFLATAMVGHYKNQKEQQEDHEDRFYRSENNE